MTENELAVKILIELYTAWFPHLENRNLEYFWVNIGSDRRTFDDAIENLISIGLIEREGFRDHYRLTPSGVHRVEEVGIVTTDFAAEKRRNRARMLEVLDAADRFERVHHGRSFGELARELDLTEEEALGAIMVLDDAGLAEKTTVGSIRITREGRRWLEQWHRREELAAEYSRIRKLAPGPRGIALQKLLASVIANQGWNTEEGARTPHEEMDVIVSLGAEYYLSEDSATLIL